MSDAVVETAGERAVRLHEQMKRAVMATISEPERFGEDCVSEGSVSLLEAPAGHTDSWYLKRACWAAQGWVTKYVGRQRERVLTFGSDIDNVDTEGHHWSGGSDEEAGEYE